MFNNPLGKLIGLATFICFPAAAFDESRLWLPLSYQTLYLQLKDAAENVDALERCSEILDGTIDLEQSRKDHPIFRFRCRQVNGRTYSEMVDGISLETLTTKIPSVKNLSEEEKERLRLEEEKRKLEEKMARLAKAREVCEAYKAERTRLMLNMNDLERQPEPESLGENHWVFRINFDAEGGSGELLEFQARCEVRETEIQRFEMGKRPTG